jgi:hypothetical protein
MPIPDLERKRVEDLLVNFCDRIPAHIRPKLTNEFVFKGNAVELYERRPRYDDRTQHTESKYARLVYSPGSGAWGLRWRDRHGKWHLYKGFEDGHAFADLLVEVRRDPTNIFFG